MEYIAGIDGGGTKTECVIGDSRGRILGRGLAGPSNYQVTGEKGFKEAVLLSLKKAGKNIKGNIFPLKVIWLGLAGSRREKDRKRLSRWVKELKIARKIIITTDAHSTLIGALGQDYGLVVMAGTGAIAFGKNRKGKEAFVSGWGYLLGDEGGGFWLGQEALQSLVREVDGRGKKTILSKKILKHWKIKNLDELVELIYRSPHPNKKIAEIVPLVIEAGQRGDKLAVSLLKEAGRELGLAGKVAIKKLKLEKEKFETSLVGPLFKHSQIIKEECQKIIRKTAPQSKIIVPKFSPAQGAFFLGLPEPSLFS